jgi:universal stress protein A
MCMPMYRHVLAAIDLLENSAAVLQHAAPLAELFEARLTVLHVVNYSLSPDLDYVMPRPDERENELLESARKKLDELLEREALSNGGVETMVVSGRPKVEIARIAERDEVDLIIVGAHGRHGISGLLGSTTDRVLHNANCDVLTVRP